MMNSIAIRQFSPSSGFVRRAAACTKATSTLYDMPVSNHGARCRFVIYKKGLEKDYNIVGPSTIGGLKVSGPPTAAHASTTA